jgi:hypothetical protein
MAKVVNLRSYRNKALEQRAFGPWHKRFGGQFTQDTRLLDFSDKTLYSLALPGEESAVAYYEFIMGVLELGAAAKFYYLEKKAQLIVVDIHLFFADQIRFEMMRRLKWLSNFPCFEYSLIEIVQRYKSLKDITKQNPPELLETHPDYADYSSLTTVDKGVFIRRMLPQALETFKENIDS